MTRTDRRVLFEIPDYWTPEQALAVYELIAGLREIILSRYEAQISDALREECAPSPAPEHNSDPSQAGAPPRASNPYFGSTPPEAYFRPAEHLEPTRAAAVKDGRHASVEARSPLPGRSLTAASTPAAIGGSGPEGHHPNPGLPHGKPHRGCVAFVRSPYPMAGALGLAALLPRGAL
jgi:hypothetical protein